MAKQRSNEANHVQRPACRLYYGDCLDAIQKFREEDEYGCVDLIYLDPPFNSKANYNVLFGTGEDPAQREAFRDLWTWNQKDEQTFKRLQAGSNRRLAHTCEGLHNILGPSGMLSYLLFMGERIAALRTVLKEQGSLYLHCDDAACHYLKVLLDAIFGAQNFRNHLVWRRAIAHNDPSRFGRVLDHILFYARGQEPYWNGEAIAAPKSRAELNRAYPLQD